MAYKIDDHTLRIQTRMKTNVPLAIRFMLNDIKDKSVPVTPKLSGALRSNIRIDVKGKRGKIHWGQKYAAYQERGYTSGEVRRYTTPGTGAHFAENAVMKVARRADRHFKKARIVT